MSGELALSLYVYTLMVAGLGWAVAVVGVVVTAVYRRARLKYHPSRWSAQAR